MTSSAINSSSIPGNFLIKSDMIQDKFAMHVNSINDILHIKNVLPEPLSSKFSESSLSNLSVKLQNAENRISKILSSKSYKIGNFIVNAFNSIKNPLNVYKIDPEGTCNFGIGIKGKNKSPADYTAVLGYKLIDIVGVINRRNDGAFWHCDAFLSETKVMHSIIQLITKY